jgi:hypothetical protein
MRSGYVKAGPFTYLLTERDNGNPLLFPVPLLTLLNGRAYTRYSPIVSPSWGMMSFLGLMC